MRRSRKEIEFLGDSLFRLRGFPAGPRREAGFQLDRLQQGENPDDWKPMPAIGAGVREIRIRDASGAFRVIYIANLLEVIYVLHAFQKKAQTTPKRDLDLAVARLRALRRGS